MQEVASEVFAFRRNFNARISHDLALNEDLIEALDAINVELTAYATKYKKCGNLITIATKYNKESYLLRGILSIRNASHKILSELPPSESDEEELTVSGCINDLVRILAWLFCNIEGVGTLIDCCAARVLFGMVRDFSSDGDEIYIDFMLERLA